MNGAEILASSQETVEPIATEQPPQNDFDSKFAALAKMERKMREKESNFGSKEKEWEEKSKKLSEYETFMKLMDENPLEAIKQKKGWGLKEINEHAVSTQSDEDLDPVAQLTKNFQDQMAKLKESLSTDFDSRIKAKEDEYSQKDYDRQIQDYKHGIKDFLNENKDAYEFTLTEENGMDLVYDVIHTDLMNQKKNMDDGGEGELKMMDIKDAAEKVEAYLDKSYQKYLSLNKVKSKFKSSEPDLSQFITQSQPKTLNNSFTPKSQSSDSLTADERRMEAERLVQSWMTRN
jgi:hypothetical protein